MFKAQQDNMNVAIASGLAEELMQRLGHTTEVYGPTEESSHTHGLVVGSYRDKTLYSMKVDDGRVVVDITHGEVTEDEHKRSYEVNIPSLVDDVVEFVRDHTEQVCKELTGTPNAS